MVLQVVCHHLLKFSGGVQSLSTTIKGAQMLAIKCVHRGVCVCVHVCMHVCVECVVLCVCVCVCVRHIMPCAGLVESHDLLSLDVIRNTLSSLTQLGLIHQPER